MGLFKKAPKISPDGYEYKHETGYAHRGKVSDLLAEGWEIVSATPVPNMIKLTAFVLRRKAG